jgi:hypothetical protein
MIKINLALSIALIADRRKDRTKLTIVLKLSCMYHKSDRRTLVYIGLLKVHTRTDENLCLLKIYLPPLNAVDHTRCLF